jgi:hypothetical protein
MPTWQGWVSHYFIYGSFFGLDQTLSLARRLTSRLFAMSSRVKAPVPAGATSDWRDACGKLPAFPFAAY